MTYRNLYHAWTHRAQGHLYQGFPGPIFTRWSAVVSGAIIILWFHAYIQ